MKAFCLVIGLFFMVAARCSGPWKAKEKPKAASSEAKTDTVAMVGHEAQVSFKKDIQPIFENRCQPCHFPGGKMYTKLPFDEAETIIEIGEGFFSRIKNEEEQQLIRTFLEQQAH